MVFVLVREVYEGPFSGNASTPLNISVIKQSIYIPELTWRSMASHPQRRCFSVVIEDPGMNRRFFLERVVTPRIITRV